MKNSRTLGLFAMALTALACALPRTATAAGDVRSIEFYGNPKGEVGVVEDLSRPLVAGDKVQFKIRLANREWERTYDGDDSDYVNPWMIKPLYGYAISNAYPQVGVRVSGGLRYADIVDVVRPEGEVGKYHTDLICRYTVKAGDFAMPLKLANSSGTAAAMEADPKDTTATPEQKDYYLTAKNIWGIFPTYPTDNASTNRLEFYFGPEVLPYPNSGDFRGTEVRDYTLAGANIQIRAVDLDSVYADEDNGVWRNIAAGTTSSTPALPRIAIAGGASDTYSYYVWTKDADVAEVEGGTSYVFGDGVTRKVAKVTVTAGDESVTFPIRAKVGQEGKTTEVYMADTPTNIYNRAGTLLTNFTVRAIQVVEPPPPSISLVLDPVAGVVSTSTNNAMSVASLSVELSEAWSQDVTVLVTPTMRSESGTDPFTFIGLSTEASGREYYDQKVVKLTVPAGMTVSSQSLYVYANRSTDDTAKGIRFTPSIDPASANATAATAFFTGTITPVTLQINHCNPVILSPSNGAVYQNIPANTDMEFTLVLADAQGELDGKYTVYIDQNQSGSYVAIPDLTPSANGELTFTTKYTVGGKDYNTRVYVVNQDGYDSGKNTPLRYTVKVAKAKTVDMASFDESGKECRKFNEGDTAEVSFSFSEEFDNNGATGYVFLEPADANSRDLVECDAFDSGIPIRVGETNADATASITFLDGLSAKGTVLSYNVVVRSSNDVTDDSNIIGIWGSKALSLTVCNVAPSVSSISVSDTPSYVNGETNAVLTAAGVQYRFDFESVDDGELDLANAGFTTVVQFWDGGKVQKTERIYGDPYGQPLYYAFINAGVNKITAYSYDKDMDAKEGRSNSFTIYVETTDAPAISISSHNGTAEFSESDTGVSKSRIDIDLNVPPEGLASGSALTVQLEVKRLGSNDGALPVLNKDTVTFKNGVSQQYVFFSSLDGTSESEAKGFSLVAKVIDTTQSPDAAKTWADYYGEGTWDFTVLNEAPVIGPGQATTNEVTAAINVPVTIVWSVNDIAVDQKTMTVEWTGTGAGIDRQVMDVSGGSREKEVTFTSAGHKTVTLTVRDKDGGYDTRNYLYYVAPSKVVELYPRQPSSGGISAFSKNFTGAAGIGAGRVWADGATAPTEVANFVQKWSYAPEDLSLNIYALGYKVGDVDDGSLTPGNDFALSTGGTLAPAAPYYSYSELDDKDSFFYCWILNSHDGEENSASYTGAHLNGTVDPEVGRSAIVASQKVGLPEYEEDAVTYDVTVLEAIFSLEYLSADNVGDINQDGIPDVYAAATSWSGSSTAGDGGSGANLLCSIAAGTGLDDASPSDVKNIAKYNGDEDYLPSTSSAGRTLIPNADDWATAGGDFTAFLEIRGFHEGLNLRSKNNGLNRNVYGDWISEPAFSKAEWFAIAQHNSGAGVTPDDLKDEANWDANIATLTDYIKNNAKSWIPENRTDPTIEDTDDDGFPDGFEYYFWYSAAVGSIDADGNWVRLEGSKFSLKDIATGEVLTSDEIEVAFNPTVAATVEATERDTDNDGLTDLEELAMGTNPINWDTDGDGLSDYWEIMNGMHPISAAKNAEGVSQGADMNADGDFMARYDTEATYAVVDIPGVGLFALPENGAAMLTDADAFSEAALAGFQGIKVFRYGKATENEFVPVFCGGAVKNLASETGAVTGEAKPLDALVYELGDATNATITVLRDQKVSLLHDQVYAQFGFDPRTAWNKLDSGYVAGRWDDSAAGEAGKAVNTVPFTARDEYLLLKYRYETGKSGFSLASDEASWADRKCADVFTKGTTSPNVPFTAFSWLDGKLSEDTAVDTTTFTSAVHGADTDGDGVPDGWELYVKHNPNSKDDASAADDGDDLTLVKEYAGTDSCGVYASCDTIITNAPGVVSGWYNKFFPTDPWDADTDGDGITDSDEGDTWKAEFVFGNKAAGEDETTVGTELHEFTFIYGTLADDGSTCIRGGGLNPCTVDTDYDGLPDPWERQFAGVVFTSEGQPDGTLSLTDDQITLIHRSDGFGSGDTISLSNAYITAGMDGTFGRRLDDVDFTGDAYTNPKFTDPVTGTVRDYDFDHDGLQNYQEYLVQALRHLRYDDASTPLMGQWMPNGTPESLQFFGFLPMNAMDGDTFFATVKAAGYPATAAWDFRTLGYFAVPPKAWDPAALLATGGTNYDAAGYRYMLPPQFTAALGPVKASGYCSTDPRNWDSDGDGMDDYYELFHGLNPLLGDVTGGRIDQDLIAQVYGGSIANWCNAWTGWPKAAPDDPTYDAMKYPWLIGTPGCDADGDGLNNYEETLYANITSPQPTHTDPTPLWMTDSSSRFSASFTAQYYKIDADRDFAAYPWKAADADGYVFAFEENEGYDTDHDGLSDSEEKKLTSTDRSDPLDYTDPDRRQALWFPGENAAAVSYNCPPANLSDLAFDAFRQFTVEAWINPEDVAREQVILERAVNYSANTLSNNVGQIRANFRLGILADGRVYGMFDNSDAVPTGTEKSCETVLGTKLEVGKWTHLALTFDGSRLVLYVDGAQVDVAQTSLVPANGIIGMTQQPAPNATSFPSSGYTVLTTRAIVLGAQAKAAAALLLSDKTEWEHFGAFYKGYIDEVRIWDGAKTAEDIETSYTTRLTKDDVAALREKVYTSYTAGATRNDNDANLTLPVELVYHYNFQTLPGAVEAKDVMWEPSGFTKNVLDNVRVAGEDVPGDLYCGWWYDMPVHSTVYRNYRWVPWIPNMVSHLPALDGSTVDSKYWGERVAGMCAASEVATSGDMTTYTFPNTMNPYSYYHTVGGSDVTYYYNRLVALANVESDLFAEALSRNAFQKERSSLGTTDLLPLGGAFAKRCAEMWDGVGAADAWTYTGDDLDANGIPDWWEAYAVANYGAAADDFSWTTLVTRNGVQMTAREAYIRDLADGMLPNGTVDTAFNRSTVDVDGDGFPDWWQTLYGLTTSEGRTDNDNDGLSNMAEYLSSEVLTSLGFPEISPLAVFSKKSEGVVVPDYFLKVGSLYLGEMLADHDFCEDDWEDLYSKQVGAGSTRLYASRFVSDLWADYDNDGWGNWAECRAGTDPTRESSTSYVEASVAEYPVPTVGVAVRYNGSTSVGGQIVVRAYKAHSEAGKPDASWTMNIGDGDTADKTDSASKSDANANATVGTSYTRQLGMNPGGKVTYSLGNGAIVPGSVEIAFKDLVAYSTYLEAWLSPSEALWCTGIRDYYSGKQTTTADLYTALGSDGKPSAVCGTVDYENGTVTIDFDKLSPYLYQNWVATDSGTATRSETSYSFSWGAPGNDGIYDRLKAANSFVKITWNGQVVTSERTWAFNVAQADKGHLRSGKNTFEAFLDLNGDGVWTAGEPYGVATDVDVGWSKAAFTVELTDTTPQMFRIDLASAAASNDFEAQKSLNDRGVASSISVKSNKALAEDRIGLDMPASYEISTRVRLLLSEVNGMANRAASGNSYAVGGVALDVTKNLKENPVLSERDLLQTGDLDLAWGTSLANGATAMNVSFANMTSATFRVVLGDSPISTYVQTNINALATAFVNTYEAGAAGNQTKCVPVNVESTVYGARPTFSWTHASTIGKDYPAFRLRVWKSDGKTLVYDSGDQKAPPRDAAGRYTWAPPIYADMATPEGVIFSTTNNYKWSVSMLDAKFTTPNTSETMADFRLECSGANGAVSDYGACDVTVKYFGPVKPSFKAATLKGLVHVQAFTSPDFSGEPVAEGFLRSGTVMTSLTSNEANCTLIGLPPDTYYVRAFIDGNGNGAFDSWESWGYANYVGLDTATLYTPRPIEIVRGSTKRPSATVYIEDMDTDGDGFPDAWEYVQKASLRQIGPASGNTFFTRINPKLASTLSAISALKEAGLASAPVVTMLSLNGTDGATASTLEALNLLAGEEAPEISETVTVSIAAFSLTDGITLDTSSATDDGGSDAVTIAANAAVTVSLVGADTLDFADATEVTVKTVTIPSNADGTITITADELRQAISDSGLSSKAFFKAKLTSAR